jgi:hypothetical protein
MRLDKAPSTNLNIPRIERAILPGGQTVRMAVPRACTNCDERLFASDVSIQDGNVSIICRYCGFSDLDVE